MDLQDKELIAEFVVESQEGLMKVENQMLAIESAGENIDGDLVNAVFRTMHTIKGTAGFLGLDRIGSLAHGLEEVLNNLRNREIIPTSDLVSCVLRAADFMKGLIDAVEQSNESDVLPFVEELQQYRPGAAPAKAASPASTKSETTADDTSEKSEIPATETPRMGDLLVERCNVAPQEIDLALQQQSAGDPRHLGEILVDKGVVQAQDVRDALTTIHEGKTAAAAAESNIRVDVGLLDKLMNLVGELVLARNQILQATATDKDSSFLGTTQRLNQITTELQEGVMKTRMQPIGNVWTKFPRVVRDLSSQLGKQVRIELDGKETELDKTIVEAIKDPLTHLVRNSVDHGIEAPDVRLAAGKPAEGVLRLRAFHEGGQVNIEIIDDGAGLNMDRIRRKAVERGLVSQDQATRMTDREASQLILLPGFSTAEKVTSVSGRGVGMDVVKTNIERIGGTIDVQSVPGTGVTIKIKIPLTLAIIPALVITSGGDRYAIPQVSLLELVRLDREEAQRQIEYVHGAAVYRLRGKLLPLVDLGEQLGHASQPGDMLGNEITGNEKTSDGAVNIVVLRANDCQFGLIVDRINDTEEIVVKPLSRQLKHLNHYAGATIMGDGAVALILDVTGIAAAAGLVGEIRDHGMTAGASRDTISAASTESLLIVDLGDARRFALPISMISRLEKVSRASIECADGREVIQYRGDILPLVRLEDIFGSAAASMDDSIAHDDLQIVVYAGEGGPCGLIVNRIVDIVETELHFDAARSQADRLLGTTVIQERVTDVLNLRSIAQQAAGHICA